MRSAWSSPQGYAFGGAVLTVGGLIHIIVLLLSLWSDPTARGHQGSTLQRVASTLDSIGYLFVPWCLHAVYLVIFHAAEFVLTAWYRPRQLSFRSFLLDHSYAYGIAQAVAAGEYVIEATLFPDLKRYSPLFGVTQPAGWLHQAVTCGITTGAVLAAVGLALRIAAIAQAGASFHHIVQGARASDHSLITTGLYSVLRHPAYFGWFWYVVGTQLLLMNPVCLMLHTAAAVQFFKTRCYNEENALIQQYGEEYIAYAAKKPTGIPFVDGMGGFMRTRLQQRAAIDRDRQREMAAVDRNRQQESITREGRPEEDSADDDENELKKA